MRTPNKSELDDYETGISGVIRKEYHVTCPLCVNIHVTECANKNKFTVDLRNNGWVLTSVIGWVCSRCYNGS
mgnify:CR=1 FL=1